MGAKHPNPAPLGPKPPASPGPPPRRFSEDYLGLFSTPRPSLEPADLLAAIANMSPAERRRLKDLLDGAGSEGLIVNPTAAEVEWFGSIRIAVDPSVPPNVIRWVEPQGSYRDFPFRCPT